jgi:hypothetical protein
MYVSHVIMNQLNLEIPQTDKIEERTAQAMMLLLAQGIDKGWIAGNLMFYPTMNPAHIQYMASPLVVFQSPNMYALPKPYHTFSYMSRLEQIVEEHNLGILGDLATDAEIASYMFVWGMTCNLNIVLGSILIHAATRMRRKFFADTIDITVEGKEPPLEFEAIAHDYNQLARCIRASAVEAGCQAGWGEVYRPKPTKSGQQPSPYDAVLSPNSSRSKPKGFGKQLSLLD